MIKSVAVIGAGSWGTALAKLLAEKADLSVKLWVRNPEQAVIMEKERVNSAYLPNVILPKKLQIVSDLKKALPADLLVLAIPSVAVDDMSKQLALLIADKQKIVSCAKGLQEDTFLRMSEVVESNCPTAIVAVLSGPNHAEEVGEEQPTATVIACKDREVANQIQEVFTTSYFRSYTNVDVVGVEFGGTFKNIIAVAVGLLSGLGYKDNIKSATMTRGLAEISRLGIKMGAKHETFLGLAGVGDLIATCMSKHSRNRWAGEQLATGKCIDEILAQTNMVVEGIRAIKIAHELANQYEVEMPITNELYNVIYLKKDIKKAVADLMNRKQKAEY